MSLAVVANRHRSPVLSVWADMASVEREEEGKQKAEVSNRQFVSKLELSEEQELEEAVQEEGQELVGAVREEGQVRSRRNRHRKDRAFVRSRNRWQLALSLLNNPSLIAMRADERNENGRVPLGTTASRQVPAGA
jgi:hypothetical protein